MGQELLLEGESGPGWMVERVVPNALAPTAFHTAIQSNHIRWIA